MDLESGDIGQKMADLFGYLFEEVKTRGHAGTDDGNRSLTDI